MLQLLLVEIISLDVVMYLPRSCHVHTSKQVNSVVLKYREARLLVPCLMVQPPLLFKIGQEWNGLGFHEVKLLGLLFRKALIIVQFN